MFNVGGMELVVIALVALIVLGPDKLPGAIRQAGAALGELRRISQGFQADLRSALDEAERQADREMAQQAEAAAAAKTPPAAETTTGVDAGAAAARAELDALDDTATGESGSARDADEGGETG